MQILEINTNIRYLTTKDHGQHLLKRTKINFHTHSQSNIVCLLSFKTSKSGGIVFKSNELQNEIAKNIFTSSKLEKSLINKANAYNSDKSMFDLEQDSIIIFPSKTPHGTMPNKSGKLRISISGDVTIMLKESKGFEHLMPNFNNWTKLN